MRKAATGGMLAFAMAAVLAFAGCTSGLLAGEGSVLSSSGDGPPEPEQSRPVQQEGLELKIPGELELYLLEAQYRDNEITEYLYFPVRRAVEGNLTAQKLEELISSGMKWSCAEVLSLSREENRAVVKVAPRQTEAGYSDPSVFSVIAMTLLQGCESVEQVHFVQEDGTTLPQEALQSQQQGAYTPLSLRLPELSREEIAALRASVPYEDVLQKQLAEEQASFAEFVASGGSPDQYRIAKPCFFEGDKKGQAIDAYLQAVCMSNIPQEDFASLDEAPNRFLLFAALLNTTCVNWYDGGGTEPHYQQLSPLTDLVHDSTGYLQEHVERTAQELFGENVIFEHNAKEAYQMRFAYHEYAGIYTPPHMGWIPYECYLLEYEQTGDTILATAAFNENYSKEPARWLEGAEYEEYIRANEQRHRFTLREQDGKLYLVGHELLEKV